MSASGTQGKHKYLVVPLNAGDSSRRSQEQLLLTRKDVDLKLLNFMEGKDVPLETWLDCCMVSLESGNLDVFGKFTEKTVEVAQSRWRGRESNYLRIKALCCLGDLYVEQSRVVEDGVKKRELTNAANKAYFDAQRIDPKEMLPHIGIGEVAWITGNVSVARKEFQVAQRSRSNGRRSVAGHLALGRLEYASKNFSKALEWYRKALRECPECPSEVRGAIGACHFSLGNMKKARQAFERALELNPRCIIALIGIGIVDMSSGEGGNGDGATSLLRAYQQDPENPYSAMLVSEYTMGQGMFEVSLQFADLALERIPLDDVGSRAEINGLIGRLHHAKGDIDSAIEYYKKAIKMDKASSRAARLGLAQLSTAKRDFVQAGNLFQSLMQEYPAWVDIATHFGPLIPHFKGTMLKNKSVISEFARMVEEIGDNPNLWENLGDIVCIDDPAKAMKAYSKAIELHKGASDSSESLSSVPCRLLNNAAVLYLRTGQSGTAFRLENAAIENARSGNLGNLHPASQVTLGYNMARITEAMGDLRTAEKEYLDLLKEFPKYVDCILRLACICKKKGDINGAERWARKAAETSANSADALALLAGIYLERRDLSSAKKCLEELQSALPTGASNVETYGRVALGNIHLYSIPGELHHSGNYEKAAVHLTNAMGLFKRALERDSGNLFAANGIGCVLAEAGRLTDAKEVFLRAQEASAATDGFITISDASVNLANVQLGLKQSKAAEATFKQAMKKHPLLQLDPRLLLYLARAQYESNSGEEAIKTVARALHLAPADHRLRFNAAYLLQQGGAKVLHQTEFSGGEEAKVEAYRGAVLAFENSHRIFMGLQQIGQSSTGIATKKLDHHVGFAAEMHKSALAKLAAAEKEASAAVLKRNEQALRRKAAEKTKELEKQRRDAESKAEDLRQQEIAKKTQEHLKHLKDAWKRGTAMEKAVAEGDISGIQKPSAQPQEDPLDAYFGNISEDDDEYVPGQEKMDTAPPEPGSDDDDDEMDPLKAAGLLSSSDEEDEDAQQNESGKRPRVEDAQDDLADQQPDQEAGNPTSPTKKSRKLGLAVEEEEITGVFTRYSLFRYQELNSYWVPAEVTIKRNDGAFPVLFVHGHLGSYEQMRSMASETAKELSRRYRKGDEIRWVDWYGVDFDGEPSGLEPRLLVNQAKYVAHCVRYLQQQAPRIVLVGYSMGGLIVDTVVEDFSDSVLFAITIGSPHFHLPSFVMPRHLFVDNSSAKVESAVPRLRVYAGPGDVLVPAISAWSVHTSRKRNLTLEVDMDNIPGVWGTSTHKGLVSCNQLVRQTVPLILDTIDLAYAGASPDEIYTAMRVRMTSHIPFNLKRFENEKQMSGRPPGAHDCKELHQPFQVVTGRPSSDVCFIHRLEDAGDTGLMQILAHGMHPGVAFNLYGINNDGYFELSHNFSPLPALSVTEPKENKRYWKDVIQGIDWMENSTWVLEVSTAALRHHGAKTVQLSIQNQVNPLLGQGIVVSFSNENTRTYGRLGEWIQGAGVVKLDIQSLLSRLESIFGWFVPTQFMSWKLIADLLPIKLVLKNQSCLGRSNPHEHDFYSKSLLVLANNETGIDGDHFRQAADGSAKLDIPLWHPSILSDNTFAITDPRCTYSISLAWDFYSAILYSTRHQIYAMPGLLLAFTLSRCIPLYDSCGKMRVKSPNLGRFVALSAAMAGQTIILSRLLNAIHKGTVPWIFLQTPISIISMLWITLLVDFIVKIVLCGVINVLRAFTWMGKFSTWFNRIHALKLGSILALFLLHDFLSFFVACLMIFIASCSYFGSDDQSRVSPPEWFVILFYGVTPMAVAMFGGKVFGYSHRIQYSIFSSERVLIGAISLSSVAVVRRKRPPNNRVIPISHSLKIVCANAALLGSLFGFNFLPPLLVGFVCLGEYILSSF